jgi:hypothetical protein
VHRIGAEVTVLWYFLLASGCTTEEPPPDETVVFAILDQALFLYGQSVVGQPVGPQDVIAPCVLDGEAHITGTTADDGSNASIDLVYDFVGCRTNDDTFELVIDGPVSSLGSFSTSGFKAMAYSATDLSVIGWAMGVDVDERCDLAVTDEAADGTVGHVTGEWCGRTVDF